MSGEWEYDPYEYAEELAAGEDLGRSDLSRPERAEGERGRMTPARAPRQGRRRRRSHRWPGCARRPGRCGQRRLQRGRRERQVHRHAAGAQPRRRVPDPGHRKAGLQGPRLHGEADPRTVGEAAADRDHVPGHVRRLRRLQLPVAAGLAVRRAPAGRHAQAQGLEARSTSCSPTASSTRRRPGARSARATRPSGRRSSIRTARPGLPRLRQRPGEQQADRPLDRRERQADRREAAAPLDRRPRGALQRRLDGLQRRRDQEAARAGLLGRAAERQVEGARLAPPRPGHHEPGRGAPRSAPSACSRSRTTATRRRARSTGSSRSSRSTRSRASSAPSGRRSRTRSTSWSPARS